MARVRLAHMTLRVTEKAEPGVMHGRGEALELYIHLLDEHIPPMGVQKLQIFLAERNSIAKHWSPDLIEVRVFVDLIEVRVDVLDHR
jgi:hypothetical protein